MEARICVTKRIINELRIAVMDQKRVGEWLGVGELQLSKPLVAARIRRCVDRSSKIHGRDAWSLIASRCAQDKRERGDVGNESESVIKMTEYEVSST